MRSVPDTLDKDVVAEIDSRLAERYLSLWSSRDVLDSLLELLHGCEVAPQLVEQTEALIEVKSHTREASLGTVPGDIRQFIVGEFELAHDLYESADGTIAPSVLAAADEYFRAAVERFGQGS